MLSRTYALRRGRTLKIDNKAADRALREEGPEAFASGPRYFCPRR